MLSKWRWLVLEWSRRLWVRASLFVCLGIAAALLALPAGRVEALDYLGSIGADAVGDILTILASSMLAVTTFSLAVVVAAFGSASSTATPRATQLLMHDPRTQNALATFLGSFLFGIVGIIALSTGAYGSRGRVVLFGVTVAVLAIIVVVLVRWIDHLSRLGRLSETMDRLEAATRGALMASARDPGLGAVAIAHDGARGGGGGGAEGAEARPVYPADFGYVQHVDLGALEAVARQIGATITVRAMPGAYVHPGLPLAECAGTLGRETLGTIVGAFTISTDRTFDQDPRFGLIALSEIASRALSPAVNDPGTAIGVIGRLVRLLGEYARERDRVRPAGAGGGTAGGERGGEGGGKGGGKGGTGTPRYPHVRVPTLRPEDLFEDAFRAISRDGAGVVEVGVRLIKGLRALEIASMDAAFERAARTRIAEHLERAEPALPSELDRRALADAAGHAPGRAPGRAAGSAAGSAAVAEPRGRDGAPE